MATGTIVIKDGEKRHEIRLCMHIWQFLRATADGQRDVFYCARCLEKCEVER